MDKLELAPGTTIYQAWNGVCVDLATVVAISEMKKIHPPGWGTAGNWAFYIHCKYLQNPISFTESGYDGNIKERFENERLNLINVWTEFKQNEPFK